MFNLKRTICPLLVLITLASAGAAQAATYYVATTGNDGYTCANAQNVNTPKLTIAAGIRCLTSGDMLMVRAGTYSGQTISSVPSGAPGSYTVVRGYPGERPVITNPGGGARGVNFEGVHRYIEIRGFEFNGVFNCMKLINTTAGGIHHINYKGNLCHDTVSHGLLIDPTTFGHCFCESTFYRIGVGRPDYTVGINTMYGAGSNTLIEKNVIHDVAAGVIIYTSISPQPAQNAVIVRNNVLYNVGRDDLAGNEWMINQSKGPAIGSYSNGSNRQIYNNVIYNSTKAPAILANYGSDTSKFYNNTVYNMVDNSYGFALFAGTGTGHEIKNNIAYRTGGIFIAVGGGTQSNNLTTDPSFVDAPKGDFRLKSGSAAIDAGVTVPQVTTDFKGVPRPQGAGYDIGAYEVGNGSDFEPPQAPIGLTFQ